jgi:S-formylglutathione hydrolase FrmB
VKKIILSSFIILLSLAGCKKLIQQGISPLRLENEIKYKSGSVFFKDERLEVKYATIQNYIRQDSDDLIIYLHGINCTELEWLEKNGIGKTFYDVVRENPKFNSLTVVSITLGGAYLFIENAPPPFSANLETFFLDKIIPYFKDALSKKGNVYLVGHSLGGFNSLMVSLRHPDIIKAIAVISPYVAPISPFTPAFEEKGKELKMPQFQINLLKSMLTNAFGNEVKWYEYNPFKLIEKTGKFPFISISDAMNDLPGFEWSIDNFSTALEKHNIEHSYCKSLGNHNTACKEVFYSFLEKISLPIKQ